MKNPLLTTGLFALLMQAASAQGPSQPIAGASSGAGAGSEALRLTYSNQQPDFEPRPEANQQRIAELAKLLRRHRSKHPAEQSDTQANLLYGIQGNEVTLVSRSHRLEGFTESELNHFLRFFGNLVEWPAQAGEVEQAIIWTKAPAGGKPVGRPSDATLREVGRPSLRALFGQEAVKQLAEVRQRQAASPRISKDDIRPKIIDEAGLDRVYAPDHLVRITDQNVVEPIKELIERSKPARASDCPILYAISDGSATFLDIDARKGGLSWEQIYLEVLGERTVVARCHPEGLTEVFALVPLRRDRSRQTLDDEGRALARRCAESPLALPR